MAWIGIAMIVLAYLIAGAATVRSYIFCYDLRYLTLSEVGSTLAIFLFWPIALFMWKTRR